MSSHYKIYKSTTGGYYTFTTSSGVKYRCYFTQTQNSFIGLKTKSPMLHFVFMPKKKQVRAVFDANIGATIAEILNRLFKKNPKVILYYICDNGDMKASSRQKSFSRWFVKHNTEPPKALIKGEISNVFYAGAILLADHPEKSLTKEHFEKELASFTATEKSGTIELIQ